MKASTNEDVQAGPSDEVTVACTPVSKLEILESLLVLSRLSQGDADTEHLLKVGAAEVAKLVRSPFLRFVVWPEETESPYVHTYACENLPPSESAAWAVFSSEADWSELRNLKATRLDNSPAPSSPLTRRLDVPRLYDDRVALTISVAQKPVDYDEGDASLLAQIAEGLWKFIAAKRGQERQRESEERYRAISERSGNAICIVDDQARIVWVNEQMMLISGYSRERLLSTASFVDFLAPESVEFVVSNYMKFLSGGPYERRYRFSFTRADGAKRLLEKHMDDFTDRFGKRHLVISMSDITDRERALEEKARLEEQLQQALKMEAVGRLAGGIAHDFNNLLTGITGNLHLLRFDLGKDHPAIETLDEVNRAVDSAASLVRQLLAFSRKQVIEPKIVDFNDLLDNVKRMLTRLIGEDIRLRIVKAPASAIVKVDPGQFEQVLVNLALNARDAMPEGGDLVIELAVVHLRDEEAARKPPLSGGPTLILNVSDTGYGMSEAVKAHVFEPFFTTKPVGQGTGLGLATAFGVVKQAGGVIEVYSELGVGTTFKVFLPIVDEVGAKWTQDLLSFDLPTGTERVLLVEDDRIVHDLAVKILRRLGYQVWSARSAEEALAKLSERDIELDLLIADVVMPGLNGKELSERVLTQRPALKVLFTSGYSDNILARHGMFDAPTHFLAKPYTPSAFARKLREVLEASV